MPQRRGVTLQELYPGEDPAAADLAVLEAEPADDGSWKDLTADALLATAAARAGWTPKPRCTRCRWAKRCTPTGRTATCWRRCWAANARPWTADLQAASWDEWSTLAETVTEMAGRARRNGADAERP